MSRERRIIKIPHKKPELSTEPEPPIKSKPKVKKESLKQYTEEEKQEAAEKLNHYAEKLKQNPSETELLIRKKLTDYEIKFEFRAIVLGFIPNFYFPQYKKVIVLDGKQFRDTEKPSARDKTFSKHGIKIHRVNPQRLFKQTDWVIEEIISFLTGKPIKPRHKQQKNKQPQNKKPKKKTRTAQYKKPEDYIDNPELTIKEITERLKDDDYMNKTLTSLEKRKLY